MNTFPAACHLLLLLAATVLASSLPAAGQIAGDPADSLPSFGKKLPLDGVDNFAEVTPALFRGGQPTSRGFSALAKMGIDIVVDVRGTERKSEQREVEKLGMKYVSIPWHCPFPHDDVFVRFLRVIRENPGKKVFVHCRLGDDRGGMMIASYRMAVQGWSAKDARKEMEQFGFTWSHHVICPGLARYERKFPEQLRTNPAFQGLTGEKDHTEK